MTTFGGILVILAVVVIALILLFIFHKIFKVYYFGFKGVILELIIVFLIAAVIVGYFLRGVNHAGSTIVNAVTGQAAEETLWDNYNEIGYYLKSDGQYVCILMIEPQEGTSKKTFKVSFQTTTSADPDSGFTYYAYPEKGEEALSLEDGLTTLTPDTDDEIYVEHVGNAVYSGVYGKIDTSTYYDTLFSQIYGANQAYTDDVSDAETTSDESKYVNIHGLDYTSFTGNYCSDQSRSIPTYSSVITMTQLDEDNFSFELHMKYTDTYDNTSTSYDIPSTVIPYSEIVSDAFTVSDGNVSFKVHLRGGMTDQDNDDYIYIDNTEIIDNPDNWWFGGTYYPCTLEESEPIELPSVLTWDGTYKCDNGGNDGSKTLTITKVDDHSFSFSMEHLYGDGHMESFSGTANIGTYNNGAYFASYEQDKTLYFRLNEEPTNGEISIVISQIGIYPDIDLEYDGCYIKQ